MKKAIPILLFIVFASIIVLKSISHSDAYTKLSSIGLKQVQLADATFNLFIADTDIERSNGLSGIKNMDLNEGVAFIFEKPGQKVFWMKDMLFPLDFVYIHKHRVVEVKENVLPSSYPNTIVNQMPASIIIELNAGQVKLKNIKVGDVLELDSD